MCDPKETAHRLMGVQRFCTNCRFWTRRPATICGECRRYPPSIEHSRFPETNPDDWCGEFIPRSIKKELEDDES